jgi:ABC-type Mn2+/Zn2+ transport system ATPase subunit
MSKPNPVVQIENVTVSRNELIMLDDVSLTVNEGEFVAIIGPNGAGKTTLLKVILGLLQPDSGTVRVFGIPVERLGEERARIGYVPQIHNIDLGFPVSVYETVLMGTYSRLGLARRPGKAEHEAAMEALEKAGIADLKNRPIARLSGGQRQRVFIARALASNPRLLLLDEPTTGVDIATTGSLYTLLRDLRAEGVTVLLVSHDVSIVAAYLDSLACLNRSLVAHGKPEEIAESDVLRTMYGCDVAYLHHIKPHAHEEGH